MPGLEQSCANYFKNLYSNNSSQEDVEPLVLSVGNLSHYYLQYSLDSPVHASHLHYVYLIGFPVLITIGVLANLLDLWVLSQPSMQGIAFR